MWAIIHHLNFQNLILWVNFLLLFGEGTIKHRTSLYVVGYYGFILKVNNECDKDKRCSFVFLGQPFLRTGHISQQPMVNFQKHFIAIVKANITVKSNYGRHYILDHGSSGGFKPSETLCSFCSHWWGGKQSLKLIFRRIHLTFFLKVL